MSSKSPICEFKILLVGAAGVGKTAFIDLYVTGEFTRNYNPTQRVQRNCLYFNTSAGRFKLNIHEIPGYTAFSTISEGEKADAAIIMFDLTCMATYQKTPQYFTAIREASPGIPIVFCGNKADCPNKVIDTCEIVFPCHTRSFYYDISAKANNNFNKPFLHLLQRLTGNENLHFISPETQPYFVSPEPESVNKIEPVADQEDHPFIPKPLLIPNPKKIIQPIDKIEPVNEIEPVDKPEELDCNPTVEKAIHTILSIPNFLDSSGVFSNSTWDPLTRTYHFTTSNWTKYTLSLVLTKNN